MELVSASILSGLIYDVVRSDAQVTANLVKDKATAHQKQWIADEYTTGKIVSRLNELGYTEGESQAAYCQRLSNDGVLTCLLATSNQLIVPQDIQNLQGVGQVSGDMVNPVFNFTIQGEPPKPEKVINLPEQAPQLVGRHEILRTLQNEIAKTQGSSHLLVNGMGGVGKTAICRVLAHHTPQPVNCVIWLNAANGLDYELQSIVAPQFGIDIQKLDWLLQLIEALNQLPRPCLVFLDNLEISDSNSAVLQQLKRLNWHLIATSRYPLAEFTKKYEVDVLPPEQCVTLFIQHYEMSVSEADQITLNDLIELAGRHTLTVELLAKVAKDGLLDVSQLFEQVKQTGFDLSGLTETTAEGLHSGTELQSQRQHQLHVHLSKLFQLASLAEDEKEILRTVVILPYQAYDGKNELMVWLGLDKPQLLVNLAKKGWLQRTGQHFAVHPVVADVAKHQVSLDPAILRQFAKRFHQAIQPDEKGWVVESGYASALMALIQVLPEDDTVTAGLLTNLAQIHEGKGQYGEALPLYKWVLKILEKAHDQNHYEVTAARNNLAAVYAALGQYEKAIDYYQQALAAALKTYGENHPHVATMRSNLGAAYQSLDQYEQAIVFFQLALASDLNIHGEDHPGVAIGRNNLGSVYQALGQYDRAIEFYQLALDSNLKAYGEDHPKVAIRRNNLGSAHKALGQFDKAVEFYQLALTSDLKTYGEIHPHVARDRNNLGVAYESLGQSDKAIEFYQLALDSDLKTYGEGHPAVATRRNNLGMTYKALGQYDKAIGYFQLALASGLKIYGEDHSRVTTVRNNMGLAYHALGQYDKAITLYRLVLASDLKIYGKEHPYVAIDLNSLGSVCDSLGQYDEAIGYIKQALDSDLKTYSEDHPQVAIRRNDLGGVYHSSGQYEKAIGYFQQALASDLKTYGEGHPNVAIRHYWLGVTHTDLGDYDKAIDYLQLALGSFEKFFDQQHPDIKGAKAYLEFAQFKLAK